MNPAPTNNWQRQQKQCLRLLKIWTFAWLLSLALAILGPKYLWQSDSLSVAITCLNIAVGIGMLIANHKQMQSLDELQQKIQLEALALSLGITVVLSLAYSSLRHQQLLTFDAGITQLMLVISISYLLGIGLGIKKYQ